MPVCDLQYPGIVHNIFEKIDFISSNFVLAKKRNACFNSELALGTSREPFFFRSHVDDDDSLFQLRVKSFTNGFWNIEKLSPLFCARYGWTLSKKEVLKCTNCHVFICATLPSPDFYEAYIKFVGILRERLETGHKEWCRWRDRPLPYTFVAPPLTCLPQRLALKDEIKAIEGLRDRLPLLGLDPDKFLNILAMDKEMLLKFYDWSPIEVNEQRLVAVILALFGWVARGSNLLGCKLCLREVGLWSFLPIASKGKYIEYQQKRVAKQERRRQKEELRLKRKEEERLRLEEEQKKKEQEEDEQNEIKENLKKAVEFKHQEMRMLLQAEEARVGTVGFEEGIMNRYLSVEKFVDVPVIKGIVIPENESMVDAINENNEQKVQIEGEIVTSKEENDNNREEIENNSDTRNGDQTLNTEKEAENTEKFSIESKIVTLKETQNGENQAEGKVNDGSQLEEKEKNEASLEIKESREDDDDDLWDEAFGSETQTERIPETSSSNESSQSSTSEDSSPTTSDGENNPKNEGDEQTKENELIDEAFDILIANKSDPEKRDDRIMRNSEQDEIGKEMSNDNSTDSSNSDKLYINVEDSGVRNTNLSNDQEDTSVDKDMKDKLSQTASEVATASGDDKRETTTNREESEGGKECSKSSETMDCSNPDKCEKEETKKSEIDIGSNEAQLEKEESKGEKEENERETLEICSEEEEREIVEVKEETEKEGTGKEENKEEENPDEIDVNMRESEVRQSENKQEENEVTNKKRRRDDDEILENDTSDSEKRAKLSESSEKPTELENSNQENKSTRDKPTENSLLTDEIHTETNDTHGEESNECTDVTSGSNEKEVKVKENGENSERGLKRAREPDEEEEESGTSKRTETEDKHAEKNNEDATVPSESTGLEMKVKDNAENKEGGHKRSRESDDEDEDSVASKRVERENSSTESEASDDETEFQNMAPMFNPVEQHMHWCGWVTRHNTPDVFGEQSLGIRNVNTSDSIEGYRILSRYVKDFSKHTPKINGQMSGFAVISVLDSWQFEKRGNE